MNNTVTDQMLDEFWPIYDAAIEASLKNPTSLEASETLNEVLDYLENSGVPMEQWRIATDPTPVTAWLKYTKEDLRRYSNQANRDLARLEKY